MTASLLNESIRLDTKQYNELKPASEAEDDPAARLVIPELDAALIAELSKHWLTVVFEIDMNLYVIELYDLWIGRQ